jgi:hypothetical protein
MRTHVFFLFRRVLTLQFSNAKFSLTQHKRAHTHAPSFFARKAEKSNTILFVRALVMQSLLVRLPSGRTRALNPTDDVYERLETLDALPRAVIRLVGTVAPGRTVHVKLRLLGGGGTHAQLLTRGAQLLRTPQLQPTARARTR